MIPGVAIPLSLVATFGVMYLLGYSLDNLSLMGLTIAVGFVVDDAIVVIENIIAPRRARDTRREQAALDGAREVGFTVVSMTVSLIAVFIPVLFMGGIIGRLFREFAVTVSVADVMSAIVSLTVTPDAVRAVDPASPPATEHGASTGCVERVFEQWLRVYERGLDWVLRHPGPDAGGDVATLAATAYGYTIVPKGFFPQQDTGLIIGVAEAAPDISFACHVGPHAAARPHRHGRPGRRQCLLLDRPEPDAQPGPDDDQPEAVRRAHGDRRPGDRAPEAEGCAGVEGIALFMQVRQDIQVGGRPSKTQYQYTLQDADTDELAHWASVMQKAVSAAATTGRDVRRCRPRRRAPPCESIATPRPGLGITRAGDRRHAVRRLRAAPGRDHCSHS